MSSCFSVAWKAVIQRGRTLREILDTETTYVAGLDTLLDVFYKPLLALTKTGLSGIPLDELETVFTPLKPLRELHKGFLTRLRESIRSVRPTSFGKLFTDLVLLFCCASFCDLIGDVGPVFATVYDLREQLQQDATDSAEELF